MTLGIGLVVWMALIISFAFDSASNQTVDSGGNTVFGDTGTINDLQDVQTFEGKSLGIPQVDVGLPIPGFGFFSSLFAALTWDRSFIKDWLEPLRLILAGFTWGVTLLILRDFIGPIAQVISVIVEVVVAAIGGITGGFRALGRLR